MAKAVKKKRQKPSKTKQKQTWGRLTSAAHWTDWASTNQNGGVAGPILCPYPVTALLGRVQAGYGLINLCLGFRYPDGTEGWTDWVTRNFEGAEVRPVRCPQFATGIEVWEQAGFGLVDARLLFPNGASDWLANNNQGWLDALYIPNGKKFTGLEAREEAGYGIINARLHYID